MDVILKQDINKLGYKDDLVTVKAGFGRNFLIPQGKAILATESEKKVHAETMRQRSFKEEKIREQAMKTANALKEMTIKVGAKVGEKGKIFGSVNNLQVADAINKLGYTIERKNILINDEPIKEIGKYNAQVVFHRDITETITFEVIEE